MVEIQKTHQLIFSVLLIITGTILITLNQKTLKYLIKKNTRLVKNSPIFEAWRQVPVKIPIDFYFFNWTDIGEVPPKFQEVGPYKFHLDLLKHNIIWNENGTVTYRQKKFWYFNQGNLDDQIYTLNAPAVGAAFTSRTWSYLARKSISIGLSTISSELHLFGSIRELLFEGLPNSLANIVDSLPIDAPPMDKFGYFYKQNGSDTVDGISNIGTGDGTTFGNIYKWNYRNQTPYYGGNCARVQGSTGILFNVKDKPQTIELFLQDLCRVVLLEFEKTVEVDGLLGYKYIMGDQALDNGTKFPSNQCYCNQNCVPSGVFNLSSCRYDSPTFISLPHFYKADPYYLELVDGLSPEKNKHEFAIIIEPITGTPISLNIRFQVNFLLQEIPDIALLKNVTKTFFPIFWFDQKVGLPESKKLYLRILLKLPMIFLITGSILILFGLLMVVYIIIKLKRNQFSG